MATDGDDSHLLTLTTHIVSAYLSRQSIPPQEIRATIRLVHETLSELRRTTAGPAAARRATPTGRAPAVPVAHSVTRDHLICLEDGKRQGLGQKPTRTRG